MKILRRFIVFFFLAFFTANAQDNTKTVVYLHPVVLLYGADAKALILYSTVEIPLNLYFAPIIKPSVWNWEEVFRVGSDLGLRHYLAGKGEGLYIQPQVGVFYISAKSGRWGHWDSSDDYWDDFYGTSEQKHGAWLDGMLYLGNTYKFAYVSIFMDSGIGYGCTLGVCSLMYDGNIGLGISF